MNIQKRIFIFCILAMRLYFHLCTEITSTHIGLEEAIEQQLNKEQFRDLSTGQSNDPLLNRKRRYLEFPEGSSFQLVYDLIIGVVDFTNYLILGVTVALAWELPSKPPSEILEDLSERLKDGTLGTSRNDSVQNIKYIDLEGPVTAAKRPTSMYKYQLQPMFRPPMHYQYYTRQPSNRWSNGIYTPNTYDSWSKKQNKLYTYKKRHPFAKWSQAKQPLQFNVKASKYPWWHLPERVKSSFVSRPAVRRFDQNINYNRDASSHKIPTRSYSTFPGTGRSVHRIYPVFGKRSVSARQTQTIRNMSALPHRFRRSGIDTEHASKLDRIHIEHHRRTRHDLYQRIEIYLNGRGMHGHHCVLRALCETGQKSNERQPGSFVGELMRAIFTLPEALDEKAFGSRDAGNKELRYDTANALKEDCTSRYNHCKDSLWSSHFVL